MKLIVRHAPRRSGIASRHLGRIVAALLAACSPVAGLDLGPQGVVRQFCQLDATGVRASANGWTRVAPLVAWPVEPAWDQVVLIDNYEVTSPRAIDANQFAVDVRFRVVAEVSAVGAEPTTYLETVHFIVGSIGDARWVIVGPAIPPHVLALQTHVPEVVRTLAGRSPGFMSASMFTARMLQAAGWSVPELPVSAIQAGGLLAPVSDAAPGDVVIYSWDGAPYHVGLLDDEGAVVSASLSHGIVRTSLHAFPGEWEFLRLAAPIDRVEVTPPPDGGPAEDPLDLPVPRVVVP